MSKQRYSVNELFNMDHAIWLDPNKDEPVEGICYIVKIKEIDEPLMAMFAAGQWFLKDGMTIEKYCRWPL